MRNAAIILLLASNLSLATEMLEDVIIRNDVEGMELARTRLHRDSSATASYLAALGALFETYSGQLDTPTGAKVVTEGMQDADRAIQLDPKMADAWMISAMLRQNAQRFGITVEKDPVNRLAHAVELDANSPAVALFNGAIHSFNPAGPARPEGVRLIDDLAARLDADRAATGRRFGLWDAEAHAWQIFVHRAADDPDPKLLRPIASALAAQRPDFALGRELAEATAQRRFVAAPDVKWQPFLTDAAGDGKDPKLPDIVSVDRAADAARVWYRVTFRDPLPRSFGVNVVANRGGDTTQGTKWWGGGSTFHFDRLATAWITRDGDGFFGTLGVTDVDGARGIRLAKLTSDLAIALGSDEHSVIVGIPRDALGLTEKSAVIVAAGSHLVWNDDATTAANSR